MSSKFILIAITTTCWYLSSSINAIASQRFFRGLLGSSSQEKEEVGLVLLAVLLTLSQLVMGAIMSLAILYLFGEPPDDIPRLHEQVECRKHRNYIRELLQQIQKRDMLIGVFHCAGFICTNIGYGCGSASLVQVIKLLEPIETLLLTALIQKSLDVLSFRKVASTITIIAGTCMLLSNPSMEVNPKSVLFAIGSGICMSSRNVFSKRVEKPESLSSERSSEVKNFKESLRKGIKKFATITIAAVVPAFIVALLVALNSSKLLKAMVPRLVSFSPKILTQAIIFHGLFNMASLTVLSLTFATSHSLLGVGKRIFNVILASVVFNISLSIGGKIGLVAAGVGIFFYNDKLIIALQKRLSLRKGYLLLLLAIMLLMQSPQMSNLIPVAEALAGRRSPHGQTDIGDFPVFFVLAKLLVSRAAYPAIILCAAILLYMQFRQLIDERVFFGNMTDVWNYFPGVVVTIGNEARNNKVVLLGPHDRYNFGDLIFSAVLAKLLTSRAGYSPDDILYGGVVSVNMTAYGGAPNVLSMKRIQNLSRNDDIQGPYDIIFTGGEALGCDVRCASQMMPNPELRAMALREKVDGNECGYLFAKRLLLPEHYNASETLNYAVVNSLGGFGALARKVACEEALQTADYKAFRDYDPLFPDSAVMTKELFSNEIDTASNEVLKDLFPNRTESVRNYVAVQFRKLETDLKEKRTARALDAVSRGSNATIVFFVAGSVPKHDSFESYERVAALMEEDAIVYNGENMWKAIALISRAEAVISTSLHVRIMAFIFFIPRITWDLGKPKIPKFISLWDTNTSAPVLQNKLATWEELKWYYIDNHIEKEMNAIKYEEAVEKYLESFSRFSGLLRPPAQPRI